MDEAEWLACEDPQKMLEFLRGKASDRKLRLFACACCRSIWHLLTDEGSRKAVEVAEGYADGLATSAELADANRIAHPVAHDIPKHNPFAAHAADLSSWSDAIIRPSETARMVVIAVKRHDSISRSRAIGLAKQGVLLHDIFRNPFRPSLSLPHAVLAWNDGTIPRIAQAIYDERHLPAGTLDPARLAILADALLDAGCDDEELIAHCREPGVHVRGCWALDLILGKS